MWYKLFSAQQGLTRLTIIVIGAGAIAAAFVLFVLLPLLWSGGPVSGRAFLMREISAQPGRNGSSGTLVPGGIVLNSNPNDAASGTGLFDGSNSAAAHPVILISEIQTGGANANDEFIELFNPNDRAVDLAGWQLRKKTASGNESALVAAGAFTGTIAAQGYFLIAHPVYAVRVHADLTWSGAGYSVSDNGTVYLVDADKQTVDLVGFGSANSYEGKPAVSPGKSQSIARFSTVDTNVNSVDFTLSVSRPRSTRDGVGFIKPVPAPTFTSAPTVTSEPTFTPTPTFQSGQVPKLIINEVQVTGGTGKSEQDFVELYNPNGFPVNLNGYRLVKSASTNSTSSIKSWTSDEFIQPFGLYVWANSGSTGITAQVRTSQTLADNNAVAVWFSQAGNGAIIDSVGWGTYAGAFCETMCVSTNPSAGLSLQRRTGAGTPVDTDNNTNDFMVASITPGGM